MGAKSHVAKWGSSLAVRIPKPICELWGVQEGTLIELSPKGDHVVMRKKTYHLDDMLAQITSENLHPEWDTGPTQGKEEW